MKVVIDNVEYVPLVAVPKDSELLAALEVRFDSDVGDNATIRDYLHELLRTLWSQGESFSGKRPFGNSGWEYNLYAPLIKHKFIAGKLDKDGYIQDCDGEAATKFVSDLIKVMCYGYKT